MHRSPDSAAVESAEARQQTVAMAVLDGHKFENIQDAVYVDAAVDAGLQQAQDYIRRGLSSLASSALDRAVRLRAAHKTLRS